MKYVMWVEPDEEGKPVVRRCTREEAILRMREHHDYPDDFSALSDFMTLNWAWLDDTTPEAS